MFMGRDISSKMSLNSKNIKTQVFILIIYYNFRPKLCWKPHKNWAYGSRDIAILVMLKTIKYKGNLMLLLALSKNKYLRVPTHFTWSHHIWHVWRKWNHVWHRSVLCVKLNLHRKAMMNNYLKRRVIEPGVMVVVVGQKHLM